MRLSLHDNRRINDIITHLSDEDREHIRYEVERLHALKKPNPLLDAVADYYPTEFTKIADEWLSFSDVDYQVKMSEHFWDALEARVTREFAVERYLNGESWEG